MPTQPATLPAGAQLIGAVVYLIFMIGMIAGYIMMLIAIWRGMKAHERIALNLKEIADKLPMR